MRQKRIVGNWKMNGSLLTCKEYLSVLLSNSQKSSGCRIGLAVPYVFISSMAEQSFGSSIAIGAQNMHQEERGAFTGEISSSMLQEAGASFVLLGHSERRHLFGETDLVIQKKLQRALLCGLESIVCLGETQAEKESGQAKNVLKQQLQAALKGLSLEDLKKVSLAYEPVWAIGTGQSATKEIAGEMHHFCREILLQEFGQEAASLVSILYGGSVTASNVGVFFQEENVDGALIGGASLDPYSFLQIIQSL